MHTAVSVSALQSFCTVYMSHSLTIARHSTEHAYLSPNIKLTKAPFRSQLSGISFLSLQALVCICIPHESSGFQLAITQLARLERTGLVHTQHLQYRHLHSSDKAGDDRVHPDDWPRAAAQTTPTGTHPQKLWRYAVSSDCAQYVHHLEEIAHRRGYTPPYRHQEASPAAGDAESGNFEFASAVPVVWKWQHL